MKNDICIAKINHLKVMNGLPMPIKALFWRGIRFSSVKIYLAFTDLSCRGKRLLDDRWNGRSVMQLYIWTRTLYSAVSKILSIWLINDLNYSILPLKKPCILHFQFNQNISIYMIRQKDKKDTVCVKNWKIIQNVRGPESTFDPAPRPCVIEFFRHISTTCNSCNLLKILMFPILY